MNEREEGYERRCRKELGQDRAKTQTQTQIDIQMKDSDTSTRYRKALGDSCTLTQDTLGRLREISERKSSENGATVTQEEADQLNAMQSELIFDTVRLVQAKNAFKNDCYQTNEKSVKKVKNGDSSVANSFLLKWEIQTFKNNQQWNALSESLERLPELKVKDIVDLTRVGESGVEETEKMDVDGEEEGVDGEYGEFIKTLDIPLEDVRSLLWSNEECEAVEKEKFFIPEDSNEKLQKILAESDVKKFRLVQLHDKYYQRKISMLKDMDRKWSFEINKVREFISSDVGKMKSELSGKLEAENKRDDETQREAEAELERERLELSQVRDNELDYEGEGEGEDLEHEHDDDDEDEEEDEDEPEDAQLEHADEEDDEEDNDDADSDGEHAEQTPEDLEEGGEEGQTDVSERAVQTAETAEDAEIEE